MKTQTDKQTASATPEKVRDIAKQRGLWQRRHRLNIVERQELLDLNRKYGLYNGPKRTIPAEKPTDAQWIHWSDVADIKSELSLCKAHAAKLAEALRETIQALDPVKRQWTIANAQQVLAAYEESR
jgi:hypothetical protein